MIYVLVFFGGMFVGFWLGIAEAEWKEGGIDGH